MQMPGIEVTFNAHAQQITCMDRKHAQHMYMVTVLYKQSSALSHPSSIYIGTKLN